MKKSLIIGLATVATVIGVGLQWYAAYYASACNLGGYSRHKCANCQMTALYADGLLLDQQWIPFKRQVGSFGRRSSCEHEWQRKSYIPGANLPLALALQSPLAFEVVTARFVLASHLCLAMAGTLFGFVIILTYLDRRRSRLCQG